MSDHTFGKILRFMMSLNAVSPMDVNGKRWCTWFPGDFDNSVANCFPEGTKELKIRATMKYLGKQGFIEGCHCGCRGDYMLTPLGVCFVENDLFEVKP